MKALIDTWNEKNLIQVKGSIRKLLNEKYDDNQTMEITFYKKMFGYETEVAEIRFTSPHTVILRYQFLTPEEQKQFIGFISDQVSDNIHRPGFNLELRE